METKKSLKNDTNNNIFINNNFLLQFIYLVPENHYSILDQTGKVKLKDYPELKDIKF